MIRESTGIITGPPPLVNPQSVGVAATPHPANLNRLVRLCYLDSAEILCPVSATAANQSRRFGVRSKGAEDNRAIRLHAIARPAQPNEVVNNHLTASRLCDNMATLVSVPRSASGAASEPRHDSGLDRGGDSGFFRHDSGPFLGYTQDIPGIAGRYNSK